MNIGQEFKDRFDRDMRISEGIGALKVINAIQDKFRLHNGDIYVTYDEWIKFMTPYTDWKYTDKEFKEILHRNNSDDETESVVNAIKELAPYLKNNPIYKNLSPTVLKHLENAKTFYTLNGALNDIYDYCDDNKIWLGFMPTTEEVEA
jgi:hypothetical protein